MSLGVRSDPGALLHGKSMKHRRHDHFDTEKDMRTLQRNRNEHDVARPMGYGNDARQASCSSPSLSRSMDYRQHQIPKPGAPAGSVHRHNQQRKQKGRR